MIVYQVIGIYLLSGIVVLGLFDLITGRIRKNLKDASYQTQSRVVTAGFLVGRKTAIVLTVVALWIFYPVAIYGAIRGKKEG